MWRRLSVILLSSIFLTACSEDSGGSKYLIVDEVQLACIKNKLGNKSHSVADTVLPDHLKNELKVLIIHESDYSEEEIKMDFTMCFYDQISEVNGGIAQVNSVYSQFQRTGAKRIGVYKSQTSDLVYVYSKGNVDTEND